MISNPVYKLCLVVPSLQPGGMERVMSVLAQYFSEQKNMEVHLVLYGRNISIHYDLPDEVIVHTPNFSFQNWIRPLSVLRRLIFLRGIILKINPDSVLSFGEYWNSFVLLALRGLKIPVYISDRCQPGKKMSLHHSLLRKILYPCAQGIVAQTNIAKYIYYKEFKHGNIKVIGNPIRLPLHNNGEYKENWVLTVGRLIGSKNHIKLIEMFAQIGNADWKLVIVGGNALKTNLKKELIATIERLGVSESVILAGNRSDMESYYRKSKLFAFASESEGFPNAIGEAQSFGLPVVAFDCVAGPSDLITNNYNGFLIPLHDSSSFCQKLSLLMNSVELRKRMGNNSLESIRAFSVDTVGRQFYDFIIKDK